jgi:hypothetical protein
MRPQFTDHVLCPHCKTLDCVALAQPRDSNHIAVIWCQSGHVSVMKDGHYRLVFDFIKDEMVD